MTRAELARELREHSRWLGNEFSTAAEKMVCVLQEASAALEEEERDGLVPTDAIRVSIEHITELERDARRYRVLGDLISLHGSIYQIEFTIHDDVTCIYRKFKDGTSEIKGPWHPTLDAAIDAWIEEHGDG